MIDKAVTMLKAWEQYRATVCQCDPCQKQALAHFTAGAMAFWWNLNALTERKPTDRSKTVSIGPWMRQQGEDIHALIAQVAKDNLPKHNWAMKQ